MVIDHNQMFVQLPLANPMPIAPLASSANQENANPNARLTAIAPPASHNARADDAPQKEHALETSTAPLAWSANPGNAFHRAPNVLLIKIAPKPVRSASMATAS